MTGIIIIITVGSSVIGASVIGVPGVPGIPGVPGVPGVPVIGASVIGFVGKGVGIGVGFEL